MAEHDATDELRRHIEAEIARRLQAERERDELAREVKELRYYRALIGLI